MTILEALQKTVQSIKTWSEGKFLKNTDIDSSFDSTSTNPVQNKVINSKIDELQGKINNIDVSGQIQQAIGNIDYPVDSVNGKTGSVVLTASDVGALPSDTVIPSINGLATETYVNSKVANLVDSAPETLNTLNELSKALGNDPNFATTIATQIGNIETKVGNSPVSEQISDAIDDATADDFGIYVQGSEPTNAEDGDIWIDTANDPTAMDIDIPVTSVNGKIGNLVITASDVGADQSGTAENMISAHNTNTSAHNDIRSTLSSLSSGKVNVGDIVNNLTTSSTNKPLSAAQGLALKSLIDAITVPTKVSQLTNDKGFISSYTETDPTVPSWAKASTKPTYTKSEIGLGNVDNVKQYSASNPPPYPVTSVNGKTGAVTLSALPTVTTSDNGKVLMVVNGAWSVVDLNMSIDANGVVSV